MTWRERIIIDSAVLAGKPVIKGTRLAVEFVIDLLAKDWPESEILRNYPSLHMKIFRLALAMQVICSGQKRYIHLKFLRTEPDYGWELMRLLANENIPLDAVEAL